MQSKMVKDKARASTSVTQAADTHATVIAAKAGDRLGAVLQPNEKLPDLALLARLTGRLLQTSIRAMVEADDRNERELQDDMGPRRWRDETNAATYSDLTRVRDVTATSYGEEGVALLGYAGSTPKDPAGVLKLADDVAGNLNGLASLAPIDDAISVDVAKLRTSLSANAGSLRKALDEVGREQREGEQTLLDKQRAVGQHDDTYQGVAKLLEGLLLLAGEPELAARVRPTGRTPTPDEPEEPEAPPEPPAEG